MLSIIDYSKGYNELIEILNDNGFFDILQNNSKYFLNINLHDIYKYARVKKMIQKIKSEILKKIWLNQKNISEENKWKTLEF